MMLLHQAHLDYIILGGISMTYNEFIQSIRESRDNIKLEYSDEHHIIPKCLGGTDDEDNLIYLTYREHFIAHQLLWKENPDNHKLFYAYWRMCNGRIKVHTPEEYEEARMHYIHIRKNTRYSEERRKHISESLIGNQYRKGKSPPNKGKPMSEDQKDTLSKIQSNKRWVTDGTHNTCVDAGQLCNYLDTHPGWRKGFTRKKGYTRGSYKKEDRNQLKV